MSQLSQDDLDRLDAYWRAANYLAVGQIYLSNQLNAVFEVTNRCSVGRH